MNSLPSYDLSEFSEDVQNEVARLRAIQKEAMNMVNAEDEQDESEDQKQRWEAYELRNELRRRQGRPV